MGRKKADQNIRKTPDKGAPEHPAFDFFEGCQLTSRPAWGTAVTKFRMARKSRRDKPA